MRLFIDECLSPDYAVRVNELGRENIGDFKALLNREEIHPGLIALPQGAKEQVWAHLEAAIAYLVGLGGDPMDHLVNACLEFADGQLVLTPLPPEPAARGL